jgi:hypothetical protein
MTSPDKSEKPLLHPFDRLIRLRYRLGMLFVATTVLSIVLWLASFAAGRAVLRPIGGCVAVCGTFYLLVAVFTWIFGTPGERQQRSRKAPNESTDDREGL